MIGEIEQHVTFTESLVKYADELLKKGDVTQQTSSVHDRAVELLKLDAIQRTTVDLDSVYITFTPTPTPTKSRGGMIGQVHRQVHGNALHPV